MWKVFVVMAALVVPFVAFAQAGAQPISISADNAAPTRDAAREAWFAQAVGNILAGSQADAGQNSSGTPTDRRKR